MSRILFFWIALITVVICRAATSPDGVVRQIQSTARTNLSAALALSDKAVADFPSNASPRVLRARLLDVSRRYEESLRDLNAALKLDPTAAGVWQARGEVNFRAGHFKESVADFDKVIELVPAQAPHHWQRGISLYYAGQYSDGRKMFESHRTVNPNDVENAVWHFLCAARESSLTNARASMLPVGPDTRVPMKQIDALFRGVGSAEDVLTAAAAKKSEDAMFYAHLYLGLYFDIFGDSAKASEHMRRAAIEFGNTHYMGDVARVHLKLLQAAK